MSTVISIENVSKYYRLGAIGGRTLQEDLQRWWVRIRGRPDLLLRVGQPDHGNRDGEYIWALRDVSFQVAQGEVLGIIGRNGAGKSTLLKILSRITAPTSGQVRLKGRIASLLEVGTGFHPELSGRENIYMNGAILGMRKVEIERKFDEIVDFAGVEQFIDTPVKRYSSGMYVRLAFAVAAHLEPEILLVDEVLAVGDAEFQKKCLGKMGDVAKEGRTVLFVSHNLGAVLRLVDTCILLEKGQISQIGRPQQVVNIYLTSGVSQSGELIFADDKSRVAQVKCMSIRDREGQIVSVLDPAEDIRLDIVFAIRQTGRGKIDIVGVLSLVDEDLPLVQFDTGEAGILPKKWSIGEYCLHVVFPGGVLNCGQYVLRVAIALDGKAYHNHPNFGEGINLELTEASIVGTSGSHTSGRQMKKKEGLLIISPSYTLDWIA